MTTLWKFATVGALVAGALGGLLVLTRSNKSRTARSIPPPSAPSRGGSLKHLGEVERRPGSSEAVGSGESQVPSPRPRTPRERVLRAALGTSYADAATEQAGILAALESTGPTSDAWAREAEEKLKEWARRSTETAVEMPSIQCRAGGCFSVLRAEREMDLNRFRGAFTDGLQAWQGDVLIVAPVQQQQGIKAVAVLLPPETPGVTSEGGTK
jgi:hypothetical protein